MRQEYGQPKLIILYFAILDNITNIGDIILKFLINSQPIWRCGLSSQLVADQQTMFRDAVLSTYEKLGPFKPATEFASRFLEEWEQARVLTQELSDRLVREVVRRSFNAVMVAEGQVTPETREDLTQGILKEIRNTLHWKVKDS